MRVSLPNMVRTLRIAMIAATIICGLTATEHQGQVKFTGLPVPGATVTAAKGDKKLVAVTDQSGVYAFADLADGVWNFQVEMLCFAPIKQEVAIAPNAPSPQWELKLLPFEEIKASAPPPPPAALVTANAAPPPTANAPARKADAPAAKGKGKQVAQAATPQQGGFQRTEANASADAPKPPAETSPAAPPDASQAPSDGFLINGSVNNGAA